MNRSKLPDSSGTSPPPPSGFSSTKPKGAGGEYDLWDGPTPMPGDVEELLSDLWSELPEPASLPPSNTPMEGALPVDAMGLEAFAPDSSQPRPRGVVSGSYPTVASSGGRESEVAELLTEARTLLSKGNPTTAAVLAEQALLLAPGELEVIELIEACEERTKLAYRKRLGDLSRSPRVTMAMGELKELSLDPKAFFVLSLIDGLSTTEEIVDMTGMPEAQAMRHLCELVAMGAIALE